MKRGNGWVSVGEERKEKGEERERKEKNHFFIRFTEIG